MAGNLTTGGLGQPGGLLVTGGVGSTEPAAPGQMAALVRGTSSVLATLTATTGGVVRRRGALRAYTPQSPPIVAYGTTVNLAARVTGTGRIVTADLEAVIVPPPWVDQLLDLLMFDLV